LASLCSSFQRKQESMLIPMGLAMIKLGPGLRRDDDAFRACFDPRYNQPSAK
jgi:hypothetical protein